MPKPPRSPTTVAVQAGRFRYPPEGIFGGSPGSRARFLKNGQPADPGGLTFCDPGDVLSFYSAGGGGYGSPLERDPAAVEADAINGYISIDRAKEDYGVILDPVSRKVELTATEKLRKSRERSSATETEAD